MVTTSRNLSSQKMEMLGSRMRGLALSSSRFVWDSFRFAWVCAWVWGLGLAGIRSLRSGPLNGQQFVLGNCHTSWHNCSSALSAFGPSLSRVSPRFHCENLINSSLSHLGRHISNCLSLTEAAMRWMII